MKKMLFAIIAVMSMAFSIAMPAFAAPLPTTFKSADGSTVNFGTARDVTKIGTTIYITDSAGANNAVGDAAGTLWAKFISWPARANYYVQFPPSIMQDRYFNVSKAERTGCIGVQSYIQFAGQTYPTYYSDSCQFSNAVNNVAN